MIGLSGREKATIFLSILGTETSSRILRYLPNELADLIASSVNHLPTPTPEALGEVLGDFRSLLALPAAAARKPEIKEPEMPKEGMAPKEIISSASARALAFVLSEERPQIIAFILSMLSDEKRNEVLNLIPSQRDIILDLLKEVKKTSLTQVMEEKLLKYFSDKL